MSCFVKLTSSATDKVVYVNMDQVTDMNGGDGESYLYFSFMIENDYASIRVKETLSEIIDRIEFEKARYA